MASLLRQPAEPTGDLGPVLGRGQPIGATVGVERARQVVVAHACGGDLAQGRVRRGRDRQAQDRLPRLECSFLVVHPSERLSQAEERRRRDGRLAVADQALIARRGLLGLAGLEERRAAIKQRPRRLAGERARLPGIGLTRIGPGTLEAGQRLGRQAGPRSHRLGLRVGGDRGSGLGAQVRPGADRTVARRIVQRRIRSAGSVVHRRDSTRLRFVLAGRRPTHRTRPARER